jgi:glycosyltransferase involved in cell wall biosynthesis
VAVIAQEHMHLGRHLPDIRDALVEVLPQVSVFVTLTTADRDAWRARLGPDGPPVVAIPNAVPDIPLGPGDPAAHRLIAAGRMHPQKGFDMLLEAFSVVAGIHPDWTLEIRGRGPGSGSLRTAVVDLGLTGRVFVEPPTDRLGERMRDASVFVLSSRFEGFPLVLLEAMAAGLAVVAFDCPTGPGEIVTDGTSGLLVPAEDVAALAAALGRVMGDEALRRRLAGAAPAAVRPYARQEVGRRWDALLAGHGNEADPRIPSMPRDAR